MHAVTWDLSPTGIHCVAVDPTGQLLACAGGDGTITILDTSREQVRIGILKRLPEEWWVFLQEWSLCGVCVECGVQSYSTSTAVLCC